MMVLCVGVLRACGLMGKALLSRVDLPSTRPSDLLSKDLIMIFSSKGAEADHQLQKSRCSWTKVQVTALSREVNDSEGVKFVISQSQVIYRRWQRFASRKDSINLNSLYYEKLVRKHVNDCSIRGDSIN